MLPTSFALLMIVAAERLVQQFAQRLERHDIREMQAALGEKTGPRAVYVAATRHHDRRRAHAG